MRSAYFSSSSDSVHSNKIGIPSLSPASVNLTASCNYGGSGHAFPSDISVLWNRQPVGYVQNLNHLVTPIVLFPSDIVSLLRKCDLKVGVVSYDLLSHQQKDSIGNPFLGVPQYMLGSSVGMISGSGESAALTIPVQTDAWGSEENETRR